MPAPVPAPVPVATPAPAAPPNALLLARDAFCARHRERRLELNGRQWGLLDVGKGEVLLLLPGTLGRADIFFRQIEALSGQARLLALSYPESGSLSDWAGDILALLDRLNVASITVLGSSLGGYLAQYLAAIAPARFRRLIGANTLGDTSTLASAQPYSQDLDKVAIADLRAGFAKGLRAWARADPAQAQLVELLLGEVDGRISEAGLRARLKALKHAPALPAQQLARTARFSVESDDDPLIPPPLRAGLRARLKPAVAYRFRHGGHFPYLSRPAAYTALLAQVTGLQHDGPHWGDRDERVL